MLKTEFQNNLRAYRQLTEGAACFYDPVRDINFCANRLTRQQAEQFAQDNGLQLNSWNPGRSCTEINCN